jgi:hypothetical protein
MPSYCNIEMRCFRKGFHILPNDQDNGLKLLGIDALVLVFHLADLRPQGIHRNCYSKSHLKLP